MIMKSRVFITLTIFLLSYFKGNTQIPIHDAVAIKLELTTSDTINVSNEEVFKILRKYPIQNMQLDTISDIELAQWYKRNNPYLLFDSNILSLQSEDSSPKGALSFGKSISGFDVTNIADGLVKFIIDRAKQELNAYFFDRLRDELQASIELQTLFPQTSKLLDLVGQRIYNFNSYIVALREAFEQDLSALFVNTPRLMDTKKYKEVLKDFPQLRIICKTGFDVIRQLNNNVHPGDILNEFKQFYGSDTLDQNTYAAITTANVFSQALRSRSSDRYWTSLDSIRELNDMTTFRIFLGLIYQTLDTSIVFVDTTSKTQESFKSILFKIGKRWDTIAGNVELYRQFLTEYGEHFNAVTTSYNDLEQRARGDTASYREIHTALTASLDFLEFTLELNKLPYIDRFLKDENLVNLKSYIGVIRSAGDLYININERNYGSAVMDVVSILKSTLADPRLTGKIQAHYHQEKNNASTSKVKRALKKSGETVRSIDDYVLKYGSFMAAVVNAQSSGEVKTIIESFALPPGSARVKRESQFNVAINSYIGVFAGYEHLNIESFENETGINNIGLYAPVGVSFAWGGLGKGKSGLKGGWSIGGFVSLIDLGALASFRIVDDSTSTVPEIKLEHILAPGAFLSIGFPKTPISFSFGAQIGPLLRKVSSSENEVLDNGYWRIGATLAVDIPLFNVYNREKRIKKKKR